MSPTASEPQDQQPPDPPRQRWLKRAGWLLLAAGLYSAAGFLLLPWLLQREIPPRLGALLEAPVTVERVRANPWLLAVTVEGLRIEGRDARPLVSAARLHADLELASLWRRALVLRELHLEQPFVQLTRAGDGTVELLELLERATASEEPAPGTESAPLRLVVERFLLMEGAVAIEDRVPVTPFLTRIDPLSIELTGISTVPEERGQQQVMLTTAGGVRLGWRGQLQLQPFVSMGELTASGPWLGLATRYLGDSLDFAAEGDELSLRVVHRVALDPDAGLVAGLRDGELVLSGLALRRNDAPEPFARIPALRIEDVALDWPARSVTLGRISVADAWLRVVREPDGTLDLATLVLSPAQAATGEPVADAPPEPMEPDTGTDVEQAMDQNGDPPEAWRVELGEFLARGLAADLEDRVPATPGRVALRAIEGRVGRFVSGTTEPLPFTLEFALADGGRVQLDGEAGLLPGLQLSAALTIDELALPPAQPWLDEAVRVRLADGVLGARLDLRHGPDEPLAATGTARIDRLALAEPGQSEPGQDEPLLAWDRLTADGIDLSIKGNTLEISGLLLQQPFLRLLIAADGSTNLGQLARTGTATGTDTAPAETAEPDGAAGAPLAVTVGRLTLEQGSADFTDLALPFPFRARIAALSGTIGILSTTSREPARIELEGQVDEYGLTRINGEVSLADPLARTDLSVAFRNVAVPDLSPYTVKFAGRRIADGRLDLDLRYQLDEGQLQGDHRLVLRRFELGEREDYPDAMRLPLALAIALLRGPDGSIDLAVPVTGDLNNPSFAIGGVIVRAFANLITRLAAAPFRLLGRLVGSDSEDFGVIEFRPGDARLAPPEREKLAQLGEALALRPALAIMVPAVSAAAADGPVLRERQLQAALETRMAAADPGAPGRVEREREALEALFGERLPEQSLAALQAEFQQPADPAQPDGEQVLDVPGWLAALRARLVDTEQVSDAALATLAQNRRDAVTGYLQETRPDLAGRVQPGDAVSVTPAADGSVPLALDAAADPTVR